MPQISVNSLFCEDIRFEADGRFTLIGVFPVVGEMTEFPVKIRQFCFISMMQVESEIDEFEVTSLLEVIGNVSGFPDDYLEEKTVKFESEGANIAPNKFWQCMNYFTLEDIKVDGPSTISVSSTVLGKTEKITLQFIRQSEEIISDN